MENNKSYFGEVGSAMKTLCVGLKTTLKEYFTPKSTEQYPENRKTSAIVAVWFSSVTRTAPTSAPPARSARSRVLTAP